MKLAILVGHSRDGDKGATSIGGVSEWDYNSEVAIRLNAELTRRGIDSFVIDDYKRSSYGAATTRAAEIVKAKGGTHAMELHFNSANPSAHGSEVLYWHSSKRGKLMAEKTQNANLAEFRVRDRGIKPIRKGQRGSAILRKTHCPTIIVEPFFGSSGKDWRLFQTAQGRIAWALANATETF